MVVTKKGEGPSSLFQVLLVIYTINSYVTTHTGVPEHICARCKRMSTKHKDDAEVKDKVP